MTCRGMRYGSIDGCLTMNMVATCAFSWDRDDYAAALRVGDARQ